MKIEYINGQRMKIYTLDEVDKMTKERKKEIAKAIWGIQSWKINVHMQADVIISHSRLSHAIMNGGLVEPINRVWYQARRWNNGNDA